MIFEWSKLILGCGFLCVQKKKKFGLGLSFCEGLYQISSSKYLGLKKTCFDFMILNFKVILKGPKFMYYIKYLPHNDFDFSPWLHNKTRSP
jgi:hypothetical protein